MTAFRFSLEKYKGRNSRGTCPACGRPRCFTHYIDNTTGERVDPSCGRCDHESSCGYHYTPSQFFRDNNRRLPSSLTVNYRGEAPWREEERSVSYVPWEFVRLNCREAAQSNFYQWLCQYYDVDDVERTMAQYRCCADKRGAMVYPQIDAQNNLRTAKIIPYDKHGHRIKDSEAMPADWLHSRWCRKNPRATFNLKQTLFGTHLLAARPDAKVVLVESEKSAVICAMRYPQWIWVATGGKNMLNSEMVEPLTDRDVVICPDADAVEDWRMRSGHVEMVARKCSFSRWWEKEREDSRRDFADLLIDSAELKSYFKVPKRWC